ncbi:MAG: secretion system protein, partial [Erythrobacter sp.]|nr:secretion system protein [Erythrobacter sp.]
IRVRPEVSELTSQGAVNLNGFVVPALITRRAETPVELGSGQSFMIAGLLSNFSQNAIEKAPGLGDVPILGNLFRSTEFRRGETELVIVVTPYLVKPMNAADVRLPTDGYLKPTEGQRLLQYRDADGVTGGDRPGPSAVPAAPAAPGISRNGEEAAPTLAQSYDPRNREKSASAKPGFSFK